MISILLVWLLTAVALLITSHFCGECGGTKNGGGLDERFQYNWLGFSNYWSRGARNHSYADFFTHDANDLN